MSQSNSTANATLTVNLSSTHDGIIIPVVFSFLATLSVIARLVSRRMQKLSFALDDILLVFAWVPGVAESAAFAAGSQFADGGHLVTLTTDQVTALQKLFYASIFIHATTLALAKLSVCSLLHRVFIVRRFRIVIRLLAGVVVSWCAACFLLGIFDCHPTARISDPTTQDTCGNPLLGNLVALLPWILTDFAILVSPIPVIKQLHLTRAKKASICAGFLMGGMTCIVSIIRYRTFFSPSNDDGSWNVGPIANWVVIEADTTIICAALLASRPAIVRMLPERFVSALRSVEWPFLSGSRSNRSSKTATGQESQTKLAGAMGHQARTKNSIEPEECIDEPSPVYLPNNTKWKASRERAWVV